MRRKIIVWLVAVIAIALIASGVISAGVSLGVISCGGAASCFYKGNAPQFSVYTDSGEEISLDRFKGKPVVINLWASWCGPCKNEMPHFDEAYDEYGDEVEFMMINLCGGGNDKKSDAKKLVSDNGYGFPVYYDNQSSAINAFDAKSIPVTVFINKKGDVVYRHVGMISEKTLNFYINEIIK